MPTDLPAGALTRRKGGSMTSTLVVLGAGPDAETVAAVASGAMPRQDYLKIADQLGADICSFREASATGGALFRKLFSKRPILGSAISAFLRRKAYSRMFTTGEDVGLRLALMLRLSRWSGQLTMMCHKCTTARRKMFFRLLGPDAFSHIICVSEAQRRVLVEELGFPPEKVSALLHPIDDKFFRPSGECLAEDGGDYIFACGLENRDYGLLCTAAATLPYPFRVAASGFMSLSGFQDPARPNVPQNMTLEGRLTYDELKQTYSGARFVVLPVINDTCAAGGTNILEAMAMGKALIITESVGIAEYTRPGVSALLVPSGDPHALATAMRVLWDDPERCAEMGSKNRKWIEEKMGIDRYCKEVVSIVAAS